MYPIARVKRTKFMIHQFPHQVDETSIFRMHEAIPLIVALHDIPRLHCTGAVGARHGTARLGTARHGSCTRLHCTIFYRAKSIVKGGDFVTWENKMATT